VGGGVAEAGGEASEAGGGVTEAGGEASGDIGEKEVTQEGETFGQKVKKKGLEYAKHKLEGRRDELRKELFDQDGDENKDADGDSGGDGDGDDVNQEPSVREPLDLSNKNNNNDNSGGKMST
jgi:hypothetical protein